MNAYATALTADLRAAGYDAEAPWPTGGGCEQIYVAVGDLEVGITDGDAALPDGTVHDGMVALLCARDADGDEIASMPVAPGEDVIEALAQLTATAECTAP